MAELVCPICGSQLKWWRLKAGSSEGMADCQNGTDVSRRFPDEGEACLWKGGAVVIDDDGPVEWADGAAPMDLYDGGTGAPATPRTRGETR